jgi:hypothetical protein
MFFIMQYSVLLTETFLKGQKTKEHKDNLQEEASVPEYENIKLKIKTRHVLLAVQ